MEQGGYPEALARVACLLAHDDEPLPLSRLQLAHEMLEEYRDLLPPLSPAEVRRIAGQQQIIVRYEPEKALETLPALLKSPMTEIASWCCSIECSPTSACNAPSPRSSRRTSSGASAACSALREGACPRHAA